MCTGIAATVIAPRRIVAVVRVRIVVVVVIARPCANTALRDVIAIAMLEAVRRPLPTAHTR